MKPCVVLIVAPMGYDRDEYLGTKQTLEKNGIQVKTASTQSGDAVAHHPETTIVKESSTTTTNIDLEVRNIDPLEYQGVFVIGGPGSLEYLDTHAVHQTLTATRNFERYYGAIGKACRLLAGAGVLDGHELTGWNDDNRMQDIVASHGCTYQSAPVVVSDKLITAKHYASQQFGKTIADHVSWY